MMKWLTMAGFVLAGGLLAAPAGAATVYQNNFEGGSTANLSGAGTIQTAPGNGQKFLGFLAGGDTATLSLSGLSGSGTVNLSFDLYVLDSMDGSGDGNCCGPDYFRVTYDGTELMNDTFANNTAWKQTFGGPGATGGTGADPALTGALGIGTGWGPDWTYHLSFSNLSLTSSAAVIAFFGNSTQGWNDEGFGIDNILVTANVAATPIPAALPLFASALGVLGFAARRRKAAAG
jgi:hypothetical protein